MTDEGENKSTIAGDPKDGNITVTFKKNDLEAWGDFMPPLGQGSPITPGYISSLLEKLNIVYGVKMDAIEDAVLQCSLNRRPLKEVLIAAGDPPVNEVAEYFDLNPHLKETPSLPDNEQIDYRSYSPFIIVKKDQALAGKRPRRMGRDGKNVHGGIITHEILRSEGVSGGENTRTDGKYILSNINGQLIQSNGVLNVRDSLVIKGPVGYKTGNIIFPGDVTIDGPVSDGFKINSGGSVTIKQTFDVTEAFTRGDLIVAGGIIGRGRALLKVGGGLRTRFIENCRVACRKTIAVDAEIINSSVFTLENIEMGDKGHILGG
ncbi:MAG: FapA family protein, partial [Treponema sp.]|nr:FapA family protein [Treponema sp.]